jgi:uncharacterized protein
MEWNKLQDARLAVIAKLATLAPAGYLGRTALMKFCYLLQTVKHVPLGYRFTLYSYGPFDSDVLSDLGTAENLEAVKASVVQYSGGYGYRISKADRAEATIESGIGLLGSHASDIDWVIAEFGSHGSADLELESTVVYVDREAERRGERLTIAELAGRVKDVKPHFKEAYITEKANNLYDKKVLLSSAPATTHA